MVLWWQYSSSRPIRWRGEIKRGREKEEGTVERAEEYLLPIFNSISTQVSYFKKEDGEPG